MYVNVQKISYNSSNHQIQRGFQGNTELQLIVKFHLVHKQILKVKIMHCWGTSINYVSMIFGIFDTPLPTVSIHKHLNNTPLKIT